MSHSGVLQRLQIEQCLPSPEVGATADLSHCFLCEAAATVYFLSRQSLSITIQWLSRDVVILKGYVYIRRTKTCLTHKFLRTEELSTSFVSYYCLLTFKKFQVFHYCCASESFNLNNSFLLQNFVSFIAQLLLSQPQIWQASHHCFCSG